MTRQSTNQNIALPHPAAALLNHFPCDASATENSHTVLLILPAMGVKAKFYAPLAQALADIGIPAATLEQRGHGESPLRASRSVNWGYKDYIESDIPAATDWFEQHYPNSRLVLFGHSLGGQMASLATSLNPNRYQEVIIAACGTPWTKAFDWKTKLKLNYLDRIIPVLHLAYGYYPGSKVGFGGREARQLILDWRHLIEDNSFNVKGINRNLNTIVAQYSGPLTAISFTHDEYAPPKSVNALLSKFSNASIRKITVSAKDLDNVPADHFKWAKAPQKMADIIAKLLEPSTIENQPE